ncbi:MAG: inorganic diphosphatase [Anaerolineaceae bacterium]|nr:inorganic diphosphatase [Anaerolineaceae bacterium]
MNTNDTAKTTLIQVFVQAVAGSPIRFSVDEKTLEIQHADILSAVHPWAYGFVPHTNSADGDCLDCFIITGKPLTVAEIIECQPIGYLEVWENDESDHKLLATLPNEQITLSTQHKKILSHFMHTIFKNYPSIHLVVGELVPIQSIHTLQQQTNP